MRAERIKKSLCLFCLALPVIRTASTIAQDGTSSILERVQTETDPDLAELIRVAVANRRNVSELEIVRRVTQGYAQTKLLDHQIAQITQKLEAAPVPGDIRYELLSARTELELRRTTEIANLREVMGLIPKFPFAMQPTENLSAWVSLQLLDQRVVVLDTLKGFSEHWYTQRHKVIGVLSESETLKYLRERLTDKQSLPIRIHIYYAPETSIVGEALRREILALAREADAAMKTDVRLERSVWVGSGESPLFLREGRITTFYPQPVLRPEGGVQLLRSGVVDPNDLEQHVLWRLTMPKNLPLTFRIEFDGGSRQLAKNVADTAMTVAQRVGVADLVSVAEIPVEPVPEEAFLGKWRAVGSSMIQSIDIQPDGVCHVRVGTGSQAIKPGTTVRGTWQWMVRELMLDIGDTIGGKKGHPPYRYRATVGEEGNLVLARGEIWPQGSFMYVGPTQMVFEKVESALHGLTDSPRDPKKRE